MRMNTSADIGECGNPAEIASCNLYFAKMEETTAPAVSDNAVRMTAEKGPRQREVRMNSPAATGSPGARQRRRQLPADVSGFVGRSGELATLAGLLDSARLVTIAGPGGVGKTRLALRAAAGADCADGSCLVELSGLTDPELLYDTVAVRLGRQRPHAADTLGSPRRAHAAALDTVLDELGGRQLLLVLDTCEHLAAACAEFAATVLRETSAVRILATSRQPLHVPGEEVLRLGPLCVPGTETAITVTEAGDAVELFAQRAAAAVSGFTLTPADLPHAIRLCRRLDGIPLAIELAAVRVRALPVADLAARIGTGLSAGIGTRRGATSRHQTLRAAIDWSYGLCTAAEKAAWRRLSVFEGTREHRQSPPGGLLGRGAQPVGPVDGRAQCLMAAGGAPAGTDAGREPGADPRGEVGDRQRPHPDRRELDRQRYAVEPPAEPDGMRQVRRGERESADRRRGPLREQFDGVARLGDRNGGLRAWHAQRAEPEHLLAWHVQRLPARRQDPDCASLSQHRRGELRAGGGQVLAGVEDEQQLPAAQLVKHRVEGGRVRAPRAAKRVGRVRSLPSEAHRDRIVEQFGVSEAGQLDEAAAVGAVRAGGSAQRETGLSDTAGACDGDEPRAVEQAGQGCEFTAPAHETGDISGQLPTPPPCTGTAGRGRRIHAHLTLSRSLLRGHPHRIITHRRGRGLLHLRKIKIARRDFCGIPAFSDVSACVHSHDKSHYPWQKV